MRANRPVIAVITLAAVIASIAGAAGLQARFVPARHVAGEGHR